MAFYECKVLSYICTKCRSKKINKVCQDSSASYYNECAITAVCGGHGGNDYMRSQFGSDFIAQIALKNVKSFVKNIDPAVIKHNKEEPLKRLEASIINVWNNTAYSHFRNN
ncbi:MAG: hypothetical protein LIO87_08385 [Eubacterium sp.]|nr:hypothetical protein [Eubacterium sp.]